MNSSSAHETVNQCLVVPEMCGQHTVASMAFLQSRCSGLRLPSPVTGDIGIPNIGPRTLSIRVDFPSESNTQETPC